MLVKEGIKLEKPCGRLSWLGRGYYDEEIATCMGIISRRIEIE